MCTWIHLALDKQVMRFVNTVMNLWVKMAVFWFLALCSLVEICQRFRGALMMDVL
jgi:hypothetical protein